jgi:hypothetical protein
MSLVAHITDSINISVWAGNVNKGNSTAKLPEPEQAVED